MLIRYYFIVFSEKIRLCHNKEQISFRILDLSFKNEK